jgi:hypothetical protein
VSSLDRGPATRKVLQFGSVVILVGFERSFSAVRSTMNW